MKKLNLLWYLPVLLLLAAAFLAPRFLLRRDQSAALAERHVLDASAWLLDTKAEDSLQELAILCAPGTETIPLSTEDADQQAAYRALWTELDRLTELGAISAVTADLLSPDRDALEYERVCVVNPERSALFEVYVITSLRHEFSVWLDRSSGRILRLLYSREAADLQTEEILSQLDETQAESLGRAWAAYYGLSAESRETISRENFQMLLEEFLHYGEAGDPISIPMMTLTLRDSEGARVCLVLQYYYYTNSCCWSSETAE